jgi:hypothetical protein
MHAVRGGSRINGVPRPLSLEGLASDKHPVDRLADEYPCPPENGLPVTDVRGRERSSGTFSAPILFILVKSQTVFVFRRFRTFGDFSGGAGYHKVLSNP